MSQSQQSNTEIDTLQETHPNYVGQLKHTVSIPAQEADTVPAETALRQSLSENFAYDLYTHQAEALTELERGNNVCAATSTSSGKTMIYAFQIARNYLDNENSTALIVFPTKALSRDQEEALNELYNDLGLDISVNVYDGDTPSDRRRRIRNTSDVIISNYSGVNTYLNKHELWDSFYSDLDLIAIDESHSYTGIHGMHVAWVNRRLRRVVDYYGADPQFVLTSATIGNPSQHSKNLTGVDVEVIDEDGSPHGERNIGFWKPPTQQNNDDSEAVQRPADQEAAELLAHITERNKQSLMFTRSRRQTELNAKRAREAAKEYATMTPPSIESYNAGHGKQTRRNVENKLKTGGIDGVVTTNALELGIDIGSVDAAIMSGYPGTRQSFWQQLGRAGRGRNSALGMLVTRHDAIDQYILDNPEYLLDDDNIENAVVDLENNYVFAKHILCAAQELPLTREDSQWFNAYRMENAVNMWRQAGKLSGDLDRGVQYDSTRRPQENISMYATNDTQFEVRCDEENVDIDTIGKERAYRDYHEGAITLHKGQQYEVIELNDDLHQPYVKIQPVSVNYYTQALSETTIEDINVKKSRSLTDDITLKWGKGTVTVLYDAYKKINITSNKAQPTTFSIDLPPIEMETQLVWLEFSEEYIDSLQESIDPINDMSDRDATLGSLQAVEHSLISLAPLELRMDKQDLGGLSQLHHEELDWNGAAFIYDGVSGGVGFSKAIYDEFETIADRAKDRITDCNCNRIEGCPACVMAESQASSNELLHTHGATDILNEIV